MTFFGKSPLCRVLARIISLFFFLLGGCSTSVDRTEKFRFLWKIGDAQGASQEMSALAEKAPRRDRLLYRLEEGVVKRLNLDTTGSAQAFEKAEQEIAKYFGVHLKTQVNLSSEVIGILGSPASSPYVSRVYDRVLVNLYQSLNYFQLGDSGRARAQIFRTRARLQDAKDIWSKRIEKAQSVESEKHTVKWQAIRQDPAFVRGIGSLYQESRKAYYQALPDYVNPWAIHLEALYFLATGEDRSDFEKAEFSLRELRRIYPEDPWIQEDHLRAETYMTGKAEGEALTYLYFETGRAASRQEFRIDLPILYFDETARIPYVGAAFPKLKYHDTFVPNVEITGQGIANSPDLRLLADLDAIITKEFKKDLPVVITKAILGALAKSGLQYAINKQLSGEDETTKLVGQLGSGLLAHALTKSDLRSWTTLPKRILYCRIPTPANKKLTLRTKRGNLIKELKLASGGKTNVVCIRNVSPVTPMVVTSNFAF
ncbi:MAG: hypothetical protein CMI31_10685 [Opitutae bacterium]|nr:hypothetical protein [Opitutae bacterium]|tara:strand:- start:257 stop:1711 length:1455 start_codon:yes stop_codon:yes gene_type:complete